MWRRPLPLSGEARLKVVLDTNVLVSALFWQGAEADLVELVEAGAVKGYTTPNIIEELTQVLTYPKFGLKTEEVEEARNYYITILTIVMPKSKVNAIKEDPEDNKVLECALEAGADFIVTGDRHLLKTRKHVDTRILTASQLLDMIKARNVS